MCLTRRLTSAAAANMLPACVSSAAEENCDDCTGDVTVCKTCTKGYTKIKRWCVEEKA